MIGYNLASGVSRWKIFEEKGTIILVQILFHHLHLRLHQSQRQHRQQQRQERGHGLARDQGGSGQPRGLEVQAATASTINILLALTGSIVRSKLIFRLEYFSCESRQTNSWPSYSCSGCCRWLLVGDLELGLQVDQCFGIHRSWQCKMPEIGWQTPLRLYVRWERMLGRWPAWCRLWGQRALLLQRVRALRCALLMTGTLS